MDIKFNYKSNCLEFFNRVKNDKKLLLRGIYGTRYFQSRYIFSREAFTARGIFSCDLFSGEIFSGAPVTARSCTILTPSSVGSPIVERIKSKI